MSQELQLGRLIDKGFRAYESKGAPGSRRAQGFSEALGPHEQWTVGCFYSRLWLDSRKGP